MQLEASAWDYEFLNWNRMAVFSLRYEHKVRFRLLKMSSNFWLVGTHTPYVSVGEMKLALYFVRTVWVWLYCVCYICSYVNMGR